MTTFVDASHVCNGPTKIANAEKLEHHINHLAKKANASINGTMKPMVEAILEQLETGDGDLDKILAAKLIEFGHQNVASFLDELNATALASGTWARIFTKKGIDPLNTVEWKITDARTTGKNGNVVFEQKNVEVPKSWNDNTINIVADKYFRIVNGVRETSARQMFTRVVNTMTRWANEQDYFATPEDAEIYADELLYALVHQFGAFNSPVWFNIGIPGRAQMASACFISGVEDSLDGIMKFQQSEVAIFKSGSGSGANLSKIRSSYEKISTGSYTSGPLAWMEGGDRYAKSMKSGGSTRNAAKMIVLDMDHPDILETKDGRPGFIKCKAWAEKMAHDLINAGYSSAYDNPVGAYKIVPYQNANHSVSVSDKFMQAVEMDGEWVTTERLTGKTVNKYRARDLWNEISKAAWVCGDPGVQFTDTINRWHTTPAAGPIKASNPCFHPDTRISTEHGLIRIEDLYNRVQDGEVNVAVHTGSNIVMRPATIFSTGINPILKVNFKSGREISVTPNHNFLLRNGTKKPAAELKAGDSVDIQCAAGSFGQYDCGLQDATEWFKIAGFIVGDGWMTAGKVTNRQHKARGWESVYDRVEAGMCFGKDDKDILEKIEAFLKSRQIAYSLKRQEGSMGESPDYLRIRRLPIFRALEKIACPAGSRAYTKRIQSGVFGASKYNQLAFLSGLFSADGSFNMAAKGHGGKIPTREMRLSSTSLGLLQDVQAMLLNLGIKSTIIQNRNRANRKSGLTYASVSGEIKTYHSKHALHELFVYGHSLRKLRDEMAEIGGMLSTRKQAQLDDFLPVGYSDPIHDIWHDEVASVEVGDHEILTYNMTEPTTHTIIAEGIRIPQCSEFLHVENTACNLCAINISKFFDDNKFNYERFYQAVRLFVIAQNAIIAKAEYPTDEIAKNSRILRPIGLNYGDLGAQLMKLGHGYDSDGGRAIAARLASLMTGIGYLVSSELAARTGAFSAFEANKASMLAIMGRHREADAAILSKHSIKHDLLGMEHKAAEIWDRVIDNGEKFGFTVSQCSLQAPLGTISFLMGMNTTGIEPAFSLVSYKSMVGGGSIKIVNETVRQSLFNLGYKNANEICSYVEKNGFIEGAPGFKAEHLPIFDCAMAAGPSGRCVAPRGHLKMMAAIQPLITCAQSKTVNLPFTVTPEEIGEIYFDSWKMGIKCVALYRDGCKQSQPLAVKADEVKKAPKAKLVRRPMAEDRTGTTHKFEIAGHKGYLTINEFDDKKPGEVFIRFGKGGSTMDGMMDAFTKLFSIALQYGIPLEHLIPAFIHTKFEPSGMTMNQTIRFTDSPVDYLVKKLDLMYCHGENSGLGKPKNEHAHEYAVQTDAPKMSIDAPPCSRCSSITRRNGSCYVCDTCGTTTGCS